MHREGPRALCAGLVERTGATYEATSRVSAYAAAGAIAELTAVLEPKILLLQQLDHRVKNSLTLISALRLQAHTIEGPAMSAKLETMLERVDVVATVHRRAYQSDDMRRFDVSAFAENLGSDVTDISGRTDASLVATAAPLIGRILRRRANPQRGGGQRDQARLCQRSRRHAHNRQPIRGPPRHP
ncbi:histidine kinase dimerization/phosphoacceptor domain -containing protein [Mesorhizobium sangaii]|uniref:histidine kinase dimerization/phosphoacceptor domain -containing protein n=1 Tax=Mesorhizobium sangaii TaxID=505389 RepID=UPI003CCD8427